MTEERRYAKTAFSLEQESGVSAHDFGQVLVSRQPSAMHHAPSPEAPPAARCSLRHAHTHAHATATTRHAAPRHPEHHPATLSPPSPRRQDLAYIRELALEGDYANLRLVLEPLKPSLTPNEAQIAAFAIGKQEFLELLMAGGGGGGGGGGGSGGGSGDGTSSSARVEELVECLKPLEGLCIPDEFNMLCYALTLPALTDLPEYGAYMYC